VADTALSKVSSPPARHRVARWRRILSMVLIVLSCVLLPIATLAVWLRSELLDTDSYVETVAPLARNEDIVNALSVRVTNTLFDNVDVESLVEDALPERVQFIAGPVTTELRSFAQEAALRFFQSDEFQTLWDEVNRRAHTQVDKALTGGGEVISTEDGHVVLDLSPIIVRVRSELGSRGIGIFDDIPIGALSVRFELFDAENLESAQAGVRLLDDLRWILPILVIVFAALGVFVAGDRRKALLRWGIGVVIATLVLGFALSIGRDLYLDALPASTSRPAAGAAFDIVFRFLRNSNRVLFVVGLIVAIGAYLAGSSRFATAVRRRTTGALDAAGDRAATGGFDLGAVGRFVAHRALVLRIAVIILAFLVLTLMDHPDAVTVLILLAVLLVVLAVIAVVERTGRARRPAQNVAQ
jgi:hypothetical protein